MNGRRGPNKQPPHTWTKENDDHLAKNLHLSRQELADHIGCTSGAVKARLRILGLCLESTGRFEKGLVPQNKGKRMPDAVRAKVAHTWFKKGQLPHNTKHEGYISVRRDPTGRQYFWMNLGGKRYQMLHRYLWERANGPVPAGHRVTFRDGNQGNCVLENLELVTDQEAMRRNSIMNWPPDIRDAMRLIGRLNNTIKRQDHGGEEHQ